MNPILRSITAGEFCRALERDGFKRTKSRKGHRIYRHPDGRKVEVAFHRSGQTFPPKTLAKMIQDAGWTEADLKRLKLY